MEEAPFQADADEGRRSEEGDSAVSRPYPSSSSIKAEVDALIQTGPVSLPSFDTAFSSTRDLFIRLHAYARARSFTLFRRGSSRTPNSTHLLCSKAKSDRGCMFSIKVKRGGDGLWRVSKVHAEHSHDIRAEASRKKVETKSKEQDKPAASRSKPSPPVRPSPPASAAPLPAKRPRLPPSTIASRVAAPPPPPPPDYNSPRVDQGGPASPLAPSIDLPSPTASSASAPSPSFPVASRATVPPNPPAFPPPFQLAHDPPPAVNKSSAPLVLSPSDPFLSNLSSLLLPYYPSHPIEQVGHIAALLIAAGIASLDDLSAFLFVEDETVANLEKSLWVKAAYRTEDVEEVVKLLRRMRAGDLGSCRA